MALSKTITAFQQYSKNGTSPSSMTSVCEAEVSNGALVVPQRIVYPGVFTAGTPSEGYTTNVQADSNS